MLWWNVLIFTGMWEKQTERWKIINSQTICKLGSLRKIYGWMGGWVGGLDFAGWGEGTTPPLFPQKFLDRKWPPPPWKFSKKSYKFENTGVPYGHIMMLQTPRFLWDQVSAVGEEEAGSNCQGYSSSPVSVCQCEHTWYLSRVEKNLSCGEFVHMTDFHVDKFST